MNELCILPPLAVSVLSSRRHHPDTVFVVRLVDLLPPYISLQPCSRQTNWTELTCTKLTHLHDAFIGQVRQRRHVIGWAKLDYWCSSGARRVLGQCIAMAGFTAAKLNWTTVQLSSFQFGGCEPCLTLTLIFVLSLTVISNPNPNPNH